MSWLRNFLDQLEVLQGDLHDRGEAWSDEVEVSLTISELLLARGSPCWRDEAETPLVDEDDPKVAVESDDKAWLSLGQGGQEEGCRYRTRVRKKVALTKH